MALAYRERFGYFPKNVVPGNACGFATVEFHELFYKLNSEQPNSENSSTIDTSDFLEMSDDYDSDTYIYTPSVHESDCDYTSYSDYSDSPDNSEDSD